MGGKLGLTKLAVLAGLAAVGGIAPVLAADLGNTPQPAAQAGSDVNWTGLYIGLDGGVGLGQDLRTYTADGHEVFNGLAGGVGGIEGSILRQSGHFVFGLEANADAANLSGSHSCPSQSYNCSSNIYGLESVRVVTGLAAGRWLAYGTAGIGAGQVSEQATPVTTGDSFTLSNRTKMGWVLGGGVQTMLTDRITLGAEYLHYGFGSDNGNEMNQTTGIAGGNLDTRQSADVIEARIGLKLNGTPDHSPMK